jgi:hypothetical protein
VFNPHGMREADIGDIFQDSCRLFSFKPLRLFPRWGALDSGQRYPQLSSSASLLSGVMDSSSWPERTLARAKPGSLDPRLGGALQE